MTMKIRDWLSYGGATVPRHLNRAVGPYVCQIDPDPTPEAYREDQAFRVLIAHTPGQRYLLLKTWVSKGEKCVQDPEMTSILAMPHGNHPERGLTCERD